VIDRAGGVALVAYVALALWWIYVGAEGQLLYGDDAAWVVFFGAIAIAHLAVGYAVGRWWVAALPALAVLAAVPAGYPDENRGEPIPIWLGLALFAAPVATGVTAFAVAVRRYRASA
jgi:hypothetical protein